MAKRLIDIVIALLGLIVFGYYRMLLAAMAIHLESPARILFRQRRIGFANVGFEMWKFRTMRHHASEPGRLTQATRHDPRVTRVGAFLRRTSLDELPQLFNVLRGDMSLVGPRPHAPGTCAGGKPFEMVTPHYPARHRVRPGLTGLAQVRGWRGETETEDKLLRRVESDLEYIDNWSLLAGHRDPRAHVRAGARQMQRLLRCGSGHMIMLHTLPVREPDEQEPTCGSASPRTMNVSRHIAGAAGPPDGDYDADVVILSLDRAEETIAAIRSALAQTGVSRHVFVVDQGSRPENLARLAAEVAGRQDATLVALDRNHGVAGGRNRGSSLGHGRVIFGLDNDAEFADASDARARRRRTG